MHHVPHVIIVAGSSAPIQGLEELKEDFTHNITHELKTPIAVAYAANDSLLNFPTDTPEKRKEYHLIVQEQLKQLGGLVEQILSMSRKEKKDFRLNYKTIELRPMMENIISRQLLKSEKPVSIRLQMDEDIFLRADRIHSTTIRAFSRSTKLLSVARISTLLLPGSTPLVTIRLSLQLLMRV